MSDFNSSNNRIVWVDIPVVDLARGAAFYEAVLGQKIHHEELSGFKFCVIDHHEGNGGCLVIKPEEVSSAAGLLVYFNVDRRIRAAVEQVEANGGRIVQAIHSIGPHGCRAIVIDSEGNRIALHSTIDA